MPRTTYKPGTRLNGNEVKCEIIVDTDNGRLYANGEEYYYCIMDKIDYRVMAIEVLKRKGLIKY